MNFLKFHQNIENHKKKSRIACQNNENHEIRKIQRQNNAKQLKI